MNILKIRILHISFFGNSITNALHIVNENHISGMLWLVGGYFWSMPVIFGDYLQFLNIFGVLFFVVTK